MTWSVTHQDLRRDHYRRRFNKEALCDIAMNRDMEIDKLVKTLRRVRAAASTDPTNLVPAMFWGNIESIVTSGLAAYEGRA